MTKESSLDITDYISHFEDGTEITLVLDNSLELPTITLFREKSQKYSKTAFLRYTATTGFTESIELFKFRITKPDSNHQDIQVKKKDQIRTKLSIGGNLSFNPSIKFEYVREKESEL
ncbi:MAG TPA: hypothetical protein VJ571_01095 [Candidatus Nitrosotalea sp.]|nr:hypothetical protein [Candidatus Nitrosotalea sp.]